MRLPGFVLVCVLPSLVAAADVPVAGRRLQLHASPRSAAKRGAAVVLADATLAPPFGDPTLGASLVISAGVGPGLCRAEIPLDASAWQPIGGDGSQRGWRYTVPAPGTQGVRRIVLRLGRLKVTASGASWPCDLSVPAQPLPVSVVLRVAGTRYCAAFAEGVTRNTAGHLLARDALAPAACPKADLTVANLNVLHGLSCPALTVNCRLAERIDLLFQWIVARGCPDVVTLQEISDSVASLVSGHLATACPFAYQLVYTRLFGVDDAIILSRFPVVASEVQRLEAQFRHVTFARIDHPLGPVDVFTTHLASSSDGALSPCDPPPMGTCSPECVAAGATTRRECQAVQVAAFVAARHDVASPAVVSGDFNESPGTFSYMQLTSRGWADTYLAAGNPECDPMSGVGCTSGRVDDDLSQLESPASNEMERIDFIFLVPPGAGSVCTPAIDTGTDADGDGTATRIFAGDPNPFVPTCGPAPDAICWPSDHEGAELDLDCG